MSEVKQEGDFKMKAKPKRPKNLGKKNEITKVDLSKPSEENQGEVIPAKLLKNLHQFKK